MTGVDEGGPADRRSNQCRSLIGGQIRRYVREAEHLAELGEELADVERIVTDAAAARGVEVTAVQSNHEGVLIDAIHELGASAAGLVVNAAGWTHTSVAIRDALANVVAPVVEVHISDIHAREEFRRFSYITDVAAHVIVGRGTDGYLEAIDWLAARRG